MKVSEYKRDFYIQKQFGLYFIAINGKAVTKGHERVDGAIMEFEKNDKMIKPLQVKREPKVTLEQAKARVADSKVLGVSDVMTDEKPAKRTTKKK